MLRPLLALVIVGLAVAAVSAAPVPKPKAPDPYLAFREGDTRVVAVDTRGKVTEETERVTKVVLKDGVHTVTTEQGEGSSKMTATTAASAEGVFFPEEVDGKPTLTLIDLGKAEGEHWEYEVRGEKWTHTMGKVEDVEVPAGKYRALRVDSSRGVGKTAIRYSVWYAVGVGEVKAEIDYGGFKIARSLKSFTPGK